MVNRGLLVAVALTAAVAVAGPITYASSLQQLQEQEAEAQAQLSREQRAYQETQQSINQTVSEMSQLNQSLSADKAQIGSTSQQIRTTNSNIVRIEALLASTHKQLTSTEKRLTSTQAQYTRTTTLVAETKKNLVVQSRRLSGQLQLIEEHGSVGYLDVILGAHSFSDFISRVDMLGQIASSAAREVKVIKAEEAQEQVEQKNLAAETRYLSEAKSSISRHQALLVSETTLLHREKSHAMSLESEAVAAAQSVTQGLGQRKQLMGQLRQERGQLAGSMSALQSQISSIVSQIQGLLGQFNDGSLSRSALYHAMLPLVTPVANQYGLPPALVIAVITQESGGNSSARSSTGAIGLMQIEPGTGADIANAVGLSPATVDQELLIPQDNLEIGSYYLHYLIQMFGGNTELALAAYNAGPGAVSNLVRIHGNSFPAIEPYLYAQTQQYVPDVESLYSSYSRMG